MDYQADHNGVSMIDPDRRIEPNESNLVAICSAAVALASAGVAHRAFASNASIGQEPWMVIFRELQKEFWNKELLPVLVARKAEPVGEDQYSILETLDKYCALMLRLRHLPTSQMTMEKKCAFELLGYDWWL